MPIIYLIRHLEDEMGNITKKGQEQLKDLAAKIISDNIVVSYFCSSKHNRCRLALKKLASLLNYNDNNFVRMFLDFDFSTDQLKTWQKNFTSKKFQEKLILFNSKYFAAKEICPELLNRDICKFGELMSGIMDEVPIDSTIFCFSHNTFILAILNNIVDTSEVPLTLNYCQGICLEFNNKSCYYLGSFN